MRMRVIGTGLRYRVLAIAKTRRTMRRRSGAFAAVLMLIASAGASVFGQTPTPAPPKDGGLRLAKAPAIPEAPTEVEAIVAVEALDVFDKPDATAFSTGRLRGGYPVRVRGVEPGGWLAIEPPTGSLCWIAQDAVTDLGNGQGRVKIPEAGLRVGRENARLPGPPGFRLRSGDLVRFLSRPTLQTPALADPVAEADAHLVAREKYRTWLPIVPPPGETRYIQTAGVKNLDLSTAPWRAVTRAPDTGTGTGKPPWSMIARTRPVTVGVDGGETPVKPDAPLRAPGMGLAISPDAGLGLLEEIGRAIRRQPIESWRFGELRAAYEQYLTRTQAPGEITFVEQQLQIIQRDERLAESARSFRDAVTRMRTTDERLKKLETPAPTPSAPKADAPKRADDYLAEGLINPSSKVVDGQKVYSLIDLDTGRILAYLQVSPGLAAETHIGHTVGVRGTPRFNDQLQARVIQVRDLERLD